LDSGKFECVLASIFFYLETVWIFWMSIGWSIYMLIFIFLYCYSLNKIKEFQFSLQRHS